MAATAARTSRVTDHRFYYATAFVFIILVFAGFARTYYLKGYFGAEPLPLLVHAHGAVMTLWYTLFAMQVWLVASHRVALHRRLGIAGVILAGVVVTLGTMVSIGLAKHRLQVNPRSTGAPLLLGFQLFSILLVFIVLIVLAVYLRRRPDYHKRLMTLAMLSLLGPALTRLPVSFIANHDISAAIVVAISCILACVAADTLIHRRLHPVFGWGASLIIASIFVVGAFARTSFWTHLVQRMLI